MATASISDVLAKGALLERDAMTDDWFYVDLMRIVRDAVTVQSAHALQMAREAGLETPCERPTT